MAAAGGGARAAAAVAADAAAAARSARRTVKQTGDTLTIERTMGENKVVTTYKLDGSESKNTMMGRGGAAEEPFPRRSGTAASWSSPPSRTWAAAEESTQTWSLAGSTLTIEARTRAARRSGLQEVGRQDRQRQLRLSAEEGAGGDASGLLFLSDQLQLPALVPQQVPQQFPHPQSGHRIDACPAPPRRAARARRTVHGSADAAPAGRGSSSAVAEQHQVEIERARARPGNGRSRP